MNLKKEGFYFNNAQFKNEANRCEYCEDMPCTKKCPADVSPKDFIRAAIIGEPSDYKRSTALIREKNPFGWVCGLVCPDWFCMAGCVKNEWSYSLNIPELQATVIEKAYELNMIPKFKKAESNGKKVAVIGAGPAGLTTAAYLAQKGYSVDVFEKESKPGGACNLIPDFRLPEKALKADIDFILSLGVNLKTNSRVENPEDLLNNPYDSVVVATGLTKPILPGISGQDKAISGLFYLKEPEKYNLKNEVVGIIGGGAVATDCAVTAKRNGAKRVVMFALEKISEMPLTQRERNELIEEGIEIEGRTKILEILVDGDNIKGVKTIKVTLNGEKFNLKDITDLPGTELVRNDITKMIIAIGAKSEFPKVEKQGIFYAGDVVNGPTTVVEAVASGKNIAIQVDAYISEKSKVSFENKLKSVAVIDGYNHIPVSIETDFFGKKIESPFLLSAAPPSDGYEQMKKAYEAGWAGGVMKTSFNKNQGPIHIPSQYMFMINDKTYANCDNVSGHYLDRVCKEVEKLVKNYPDRLTIASTGGPVTGNDDEDKKIWQNNSRILEDAGAMAVEFSLSCPQGGDGTEGDIVSQNADLTAKIIDWIMETSNPDIPKLFKLTAAVTSIEAIMIAIKKVLDKYPDKKAGVTLANTFPTLAFRKIKKEKWDDGIIVGMSGDGVTPISYFTLARAVPIGIEISGNGGPMDYKAAANFLALGVNTVQFCTIVMKYGYNVINDLKYGVSHLMEYRGINSMKELIGIAQQNGGAITDFMDLPSEKMISAVNSDLCEHCGNCTRCPYLAIELDENLIPVTDPAKCIGCSICVQKCFANALYMRERTAEEKAALKES